jgi:DegV family protein with EDD domain
MTERKFGLLTDTTSSMTAEMTEDLSQKIGIKTLSLNNWIRIGNREFPDDPINLPQFYEQLKQGPLPETSIASVGQYTEAYEKLIKDYGVTDIISLHSDSRLTGGVNSARSAAKDVIDRHQGKGINIYNLDTRTLSAGHAILVEEAAKMAAQGVPFTDIVNRLEQEKENIRLLIGITDAAYLIRSAKRRIDVQSIMTLAAGAVGMAMKIHPIVTIEGKKIVRKGMARLKKLHPQLLQLLDRESENRLPFKRAIVVHTNNPDEASQLAESFNQRKEEYGLEISESDIWDARAVLAVYAGKDIRAIAVLLP